MRQLAEQLKPVFEEMLQREGFELFDIVFRKENRRWVLRIVIDNPTGYVSLKDCEFISSKIGEYLDSEDLITHSYVLEVSSPGLDRPLRGMSDYERFKGRLAKFWLNDGRVIIGRIKEVHEKSLTLESNGNDICFQADQVKKSRLEVEF